MKTNITTKTTKNAAELRKIITRELDYLPRGVKRETLVDLYRAITAEALDSALRSTTRGGRKLAAQVRCTIGNFSTIEAAAAFADALFDLYEKYTNVNGVSEFCPTIDTMQPEFHNDFIAAVNSRA